MWVDSFHKWLKQSGRRFQCPLRKTILVIYVYFLYKRFHPKTFRSQDLYHETTKANKPEEEPTRIGPIQLGKLIRIPMIINLSRNWRTTSEQFHHIFDFWAVKILSHKIFFWIIFACSLGPRPSLHDSKISGRRLGLPPRKIILVIYLHFPHELFHPKKTRRGQCKQVQFNTEN